jgi:hypothetical protein
MLRRQKEDPMLKVTEDHARRTLILEPSGPLARGDFEALGPRFDALSADGPIRLVVHAASFPGWDDFGSFLAHVGFVPAHQSRVEKVALVSDSRILDLAPRIADLFLAAEVRHFPAHALAAALDWVAEPTDAGAGLEIIPGLPDDVIGLSAHGVITRHDYTETVAPLVAEKLKAYRKLKMIYRLGPEFEAYSAGAMWSDARLGLTHFSDFARVAVVTDVGWISKSVRVFAPLIPGEVRVFPDAELGAATDWISAPA